MGGQDDLGLFCNPPGLSEASSGAGELLGGREGYGCPWPFLLPSSQVTGQPYQPPPSAPICLSQCLEHSLVLAACLSRLDLALLPF